MPIRGLPSLSARLLLSFSCRPSHCHHPLHHSLHHYDCYRPVGTHTLTTMAAIMKGVDNDDDNKSDKQNDKSSDVVGDEAATGTAAKQRLVYGKDDSLFGCIEEQQGDLPFGDFLDAGTGTHSMRWIATLHEKGMSSFYAITADATMKKRVELEAKTLGLYDDDESAQEKVLMGNWFPKTEGEAFDFQDAQFDTILADYLIGAMDGFSPYRQDEMLPILVDLLKPGGRLYIVGLEPIPDKVVGRENVVCKVRQVRDACILLAGHRCYREYPLEWIHRQCKQLKNCRVLETHRFPIVYRHGTINRQINVARSKFPYFPDKALVGPMKKVLDELERQAKEATKEAPIKLGFDYVVSLEKDKEG